MSNLKSTICFFNTFNWGFCLWAVLALIYFIITSLNAGCSGMKSYFIAWSVSYVIEIVTTITTGLAVMNNKNHNLAYFMISLSILYKAGVVVSLIIGAWQNVGYCYIPGSLKAIIIIVNCVEGLCLILLFILVLRLRGVSRILETEKIIMERTIAQQS